MQLWFAREAILCFRVTCSSGGYVLLAREFAVAARSANLTTLPTPEAVSKQLVSTLHLAACKVGAQAL